MFKRMVTVEVNRHVPVFGIIKHKSALGNDMAEIQHLTVQCDLKAIQNRQRQFGLGGSALQDPFFIRFWSNHN